MQYLKDEIKNRIISSALKEFYEKGFQNASMRQIAKDAGVAIGNIYRYYKNKEDLFNEIVYPAYHSLITVIEHHDFTNTNDISVFEAAVETVMPIFKEYRIQLLLLVDKSKGTKYENVKEKFITAIEKELIKYLLPAIKERGVDIRETFIFNVIASTFLEGMFIILRKYSNEDTIKYLVHELLSISFTDVAKRFG